MPERCCNEPTPEVNDRTDEVSDSGVADPAESTLSPNDRSDAGLTEARGDFGHDIDWGHDVGSPCSPVNDGGLADMSVRC